MVAASTQRNEENIMTETTQITTRDEEDQNRTTRDDLNAPWTIDFDRDGTEDIAVICDSNDEVLATSRHFWLPEGDDPIPPTLAGMWLMKSAPTLLEAVEAFLEADDLAEECGEWKWENLAHAFQLARSAIAEATGGLPRKKPDLWEVQRVPTGRTMIAPKARERLSPGDFLPALLRHAMGDWGDLDAASREENERSLSDGTRLKSVYTAADGTEFWVVTEADRSLTRVLLPDEA
jgi:hypothetical protein